jgi:hypothetical protein
MNNSYRFIFIALVLVPVPGGLLLGQQERIEKSYKAIKDLDIKTVSGDCIIQAGKGNKVTVEVVYDYPGDCFEPEFIESDNRLRLRERFHGHRSCSGYSEWTITVPQTGLDLDYSTASGDLSVSSCQGTFDLESASGRIDISNCSGELKLDNASGRIEISDSQGEFTVDNASGRIKLRNVTGEFELDNASGNVDLSKVEGRFEVDNASGGVEARDISITGLSDFNTASGDIEVFLEKTLEHDVTFNTASGDILLDYNGHPFVGYFEFSARKGRGRIIAPFTFDKEEVIEPGDDRFYGGHWGSDWPMIRKSFTREKDSPQIILSTASGTVELR